MKRPIFACTALLIGFIGFCGWADELVDGTLGDECKADGDVCTCGPRWTVQASTLFMNRTSPNDQVLVSNTFTEAALLNANQFDFGWATGLDVSAMYHRRPGHRNRIPLHVARGRLGYRDLYVSRTDKHLDPHEPAYLLRWEHGGHRDVRFRPSFVQLNDRRTNDVTTLLYGFRYVHIADESLNAFLNYPGGGEANRWDADNELFGFQIGAERNVCLGRLVLTASGKAGIYYADMETSYELDRGYDGSIDAWAEADDGAAAFLGELAFTASYPLTSRLSLTAGYHLLWLQGVAVGPEQVAATDSFNTEGQIGSRVDCGGMFYHGARHGLAYTY